MPKIKETKQFIIDCIDDILPGSENTQLYKDKFSKMSDKEFDEYVKRLESGEEELFIIEPNLHSEVTLNIRRNFKLAEKLGHKFHQRIWFHGDKDTPTYLSPIPYLVIDLPLRRQAQLLEKKISLPEDNKSVDDLTGQPTGKSKGSKISFPETQVIAAMGLDASLTELLKFRGGDLKGFNAMNTMIARTGGVSLKAIESFTSGVESTKTLGVLLTSMHLQNNLAKK